MPASLLDSDYFKDMFTSSEMREIFSDENRVRSWIKTEIALAKAQEELDIIPMGIADKIETEVHVEKMDLLKMKEEFDRVGFPILPFVHQVNALLGAETAKWVHFGATTQDILDTGLILQIREAIAYLENELDESVVALKALAQEYKNVPMAGRTFQQLAAPVTFGYKAAIWLEEMVRHKVRLGEIKTRILVGQCAGAVGTFATLGTKGFEVQSRMMDHLDLEQPNITWHTAKDRMAEVICWQGMVAGTLGKMANEIAILMRSEIGEVSEPFKKGRGASTTLPQKRNPISCEPIMAIASKMRELVSTQLSVMIQEHERPVGPMHLEWIVVPEAFLMMSGSFKHAKYVLQNLVVDPNKMLENLQLNGGLIMSEAIMMGLAPKIGKQKAHDLIYRAAGNANDSGITLKQALSNELEVSALLSEEEIDQLIDPRNYLGSTHRMVEQVIQYTDSVYEA